MGREWGKERERGRRQMLKFGNVKKVFHDLVTTDWSETWKQHKLFTQPDKINTVAQVLSTSQRQILTLALIFFIYFLFGNLNIIHVFRKSDLVQINLKVTFFYVIHLKKSLSLFFFFLHVHFSINIVSSAYKSSNFTRKDWAIKKCL